MLKKYRLIYLISATLAFALGSGMFFYDFIESKERMKLFGGIIFGLMTVFQATDLYVFNNNQKIEKLKNKKELS